MPNEEIDAIMQRLKNVYPELRSVKKMEQADKELCPECKQRMQVQEGCMTCPACGWSKCSL